MVTFTRGRRQRSERAVDFRGGGRFLQHCIALGHPVEHTHTHTHALSGLFWAKLTNQKQQDQKIIELNQKIFLDEEESSRLMHCVALLCQALCCVVSRAQLTKI